MSTTTIIVICIVLIVLSGGLIVFIQAREKARIERARKVAALEDSHSRMLRILDELPPQCLNKELRILLIDRAIEICGELTAYSTHLNVQSMLQADQQRRAQILDTDSGPEQPPAKIDSAEKATNARVLLEALFRFIETRHKSGHLDAPQARQYLREILFQVYRVKSDFLIIQAREHERRNEYRKAIRLLNMACSELAKSNNHPAAARAIASYREKISELNELANGRKQEKVTAAKEEKIDREWDEFLHEEEGWKKKADYDN